jgi:hypothetical protein
MIEARMSLPPFRAGYRASGLLLHVTALPSLYGIGDVGRPLYRGSTGFLNLVKAGGSRCHIRLRMAARLDKIFETLGYD